MTIAGVETKIWIAFVCMVVGMFMAVLDIQIVASSLQEIQAGLSATKDEINWIQTSYLIAEVMIIPICGWLCKAFSTRIIFSIACAGFTIFSLACALSWDLSSMIVFRALQGFFGGAMIPTVFAIIFIIFPVSIRPMVTVVIGLVVTIAPIMGPIIGGYVTDLLSWHYLFLLNIVPGLFVIIAVLKLVHFDSADYELLKKIDYLGILLIIISLGTMQFVLEEGTKEAWFESNLILSLSIISFISFFLLLCREWIIDNPVINIHAFKDKNFTCGCIMSFILGWGLYSAVFIMPVYLFSIKNLNSIQIGEYLFVTGIFQFLSAPCAGMLSKKLDLRLILAFGLSLFAISCFISIDINIDYGFDEFFLPQALRGFSLMFCFVPITSLTFATLKPHEIQTASGLYNLMRNLGGAIGLAVSSTWLQNWSKENYAHLHENITATNPQVEEILLFLSSHFTNFKVFDPHLGSLSLLYNLTQREAYILTFGQVFFAIGILFLFGAALTPFINKVNLNEVKSNDVH